MEWFINFLISSGIPQHEAYFTACVASIIWLLWAFSVSGIVTFFISKFLFELIEDIFSFISEVFISKIKSKK